MRFINHVGCGFLVLVMAGALPAQVTDLEPFADGTRWVTVGDSITAGGVYAANVELFYLTRYPERTITVFNRGISGDRAELAIRRYDWDMAPCKATVASIMFGMNDVPRDSWSPKRKQTPDLEDLRAKKQEIYRTNMNILFGRFIADGAKIILITPSIYDQTGNQIQENLKGTNDALELCSQFMRDTADKQGFGLVEFQRPMLAMNRILQEKDPAATIVGGDRIHPGAPGHFFMACQFLKAQHVTGVVASVHIAADTASVKSQERCRISEVSGNSQGISFMYAAEALPFPIDDKVRPAEEWTSFEREFNRETLRIDGLATGSFTVSIDDKTVGTYSAAQLADGINLAQITNTPQYQQAVQVLGLLKQRNGYNGGLRNIDAVEYWIEQTPSHPATLEQMEPLIAAKCAKLDANAYFQAQARNYRKDKPKQAEITAKVADLDGQLHLARMPKPHRFNVVSKSEK